jgi:mRNA-degrading endonuclease YafQ of YafQ-DinJ toxin-antitoxin module
MKIKREQVNFGADIVLTNRFRRNWEYLSVQARRIVATKVALLAENQCHPSLHVHRIRRSDKNIWECYVSATLRLLYQQREGQLWLWDVGGHAVVERAYLRNFSMTDTQL